MKMVERSNCNSALEPGDRAQIRQLVACCSVIEHQNVLLTASMSSAEMPSIHTLDAGRGVVAIPATSKSGISTATASRDLAFAVKQGQLRIDYHHAQTTYRFRV